jgi:CheY-like chemotaxis protein
VNQVVALNFLKKWNIDVEFAQNGKEAVSMIQNKSYQLVLMDLQMPEMDGYEATKTIRSLDGDPYFQHVPIIALTASAMIDIREKVIAMGMTDFLSKPFLPEELHSTIAKYVFVAEPEPAAPAYPEQVSINLDMYTDNDPDFKQELAGLVSKNLQELREALKESIKKQSPDVFKIAAHKMKTSAGMLGNREFLEIIERLPSLMENLQSEPLKEQVDRFHALSSELIEILEKIAGKK